MAIPPTVTRSNPLCRLLRFCPCTRTIHPIVPYPCIRNHLSASIHVVPFVIYVLPSGFHGTIIDTAKIIPVCSVPEPSVLHGSVGVAVIPIRPCFIPSGLHHARVIHVIPATMSFYPTRDHCTVLVQIVPSAIQL